jgi:hypothetical protein
MRRSQARNPRLAFGRRLESIMGRGHLFAVWRNFVKKRTELGRDKSTPAMRLGLTDTRWRWETLLSRRLFPGRIELTGASMAIYGKRWARGAPTLSLENAA